LALFFKFNLVSLEAEPWPVIDWAYNLLMSFINTQKLLYIGITYMAAFIVNLLAEEMVDLQSRRTQIPKELLVDELRGNTRAVIITMSNALSLIFKMFIGIALVLTTLIYFGSCENGEKIELEAIDVLYQAVTFLFFDGLLFIIQRFFLSFIEKDKNHLRSKTGGAA
jgi:hypothetical protein